MLYLNLSDFFLARFQSNRWQRNRDEPGGTSRFRRVRLTTVMARWRTQRPTKSSIHCDTPHNAQENIPPLV